MLSLYASKTFKMSDGKIEAKMKVGQQKISDNLSMQAFNVYYPIKNLLNLEEEDVSLLQPILNFNFGQFCGTQISVCRHFYQFP